MTALHFAADRGYDEVAEFLLRSGARVDELDGSGQTALMYAVSCENKVRGTVCVCTLNYQPLLLLPTRSTVTACFPYRTMFSIIRISVFLSLSSVSLCLSWLT